MQTRLLACASALWFVAATPTASAQPAPPLTEPLNARAMRGLFGPKPPTPNDRHSLDLTVRVYGALDAGGDAALLAGLLRRGQNYGLVADVAYARRGDVSVALQSGAAGSYYPQFETRPAISYGSSASLGARIRSAAAHVRGAVAQSPYSVLYLFPGAPATTLGTTAAPGTNYSASSQDVVRYTSSADISQPLGRRASLSVSYEFRGTDFADAAGDRREHSATARLNRQFRRHLGVRLGYAYRESRFDLQQGSRIFHTHDIDVGLDYGRALSFSRRTTFSFSTGSTVLTQDPQAAADASGQPTRFLHVLGSAQLRHQMGRTWSATIDYQRSAQFVEGFSEPFLSDAVTAAIDGSPSKRVTVDASAAYAQGSVGRSSGNNGYQGYTGTVRLRMALARSLAAEAQYSYYRYSFEPGVALADGVRSAPERRTVRGGLTLWLPIF